jgi:Bacteriophage T4-like portal protein (Gp20)
VGFFGGVADRIRDYFRRDKEQVGLQLAKGSTASGYPTTGYDLLQAYGYDVLSDFLKLEHDLLSRYIDYEEMDDYPELSAALTIYADDASQPETHLSRTLWITSKDETVGQILDDLFHRQLRMDEEIGDISRMLVKYGNCVAKGSRVWGASSCKPIEEVGEGDTILVRGGLGILTSSAVARHYDNGIKRVFELRTTHRKVLVTDDHLVQAVRPDGREEWVAARDLNMVRYRSGGINRTKTDKLIICTRMLSGRVPAWSDIWVKDPFHMSWGEKGSPVHLTLPSFIDPDFCALFGFLLGDGFMQSAGNDANTNFCIALGEYPEINERYDGLMRRLGLNGFLAAEGSQRAYSSIQFKRLMRSLGWIDGFANKRIPSWVYGLPEAHREAFLWGFIDADGWASRPVSRKGKESYHFEIANIEMAKDFKSLADGLGYITGNIRLRKRKPGFKIKHRTVRSTRVCATLTFRADKFKEEFIAETLTSVSVYGEMPVYDVEVDHEAHSFIADGVVVHNCFEEILVSGNGVIGLNHLAAPTVRRIEGPRGELFGFVQDYKARFGFTPAEFQQIMANRAASMRQGGGDKQGLDKVSALEDWEVVHFRLRAKQRRSVYGQSVLESARFIWKRLVLLEDAALVYRLERAPERYAFYVDVGDLPPQEAYAHLNRVRQQHRKKKWVNPSTGKLDLKFDPTGQSEDFFIPVRQGAEGTRIEVLGAPAWQHMEDVEYFRDKMFSAIGVPKTYLAQSEGVGRNTLSSEDVRFARSILRVQRELRNGLGKVARVHLAALNIDPNSVEYAIHMTVPSAIFELAQLEVKNARADLGNRMREFVSLHWILSNVFGMSDAEIEIVFRERDEDSEREAYTQANQQGIIGKAVAAAGIEGQAQGQVDAQTITQTETPPEQLADIAKQQKAVVAGTSKPQESRVQWPLIQMKDRTRRTYYDRERQLFEGGRKESEKRAEEKLEKLLKSDKIQSARLGELGQMLRELSGAVKEGRRR